MRSKVARETFKQRATCCGFAVTVTHDLVNQSRKLHGLPVRRIVYILRDRGCRLLEPALARGGDLAEG